MMAIYSDASVTCPATLPKYVYPHLIANPLVGLKVERQLGVVPLNDDLGGLLDGLCSNATHFGDCMYVLGSWSEGGCRGSYSVVAGDFVRWWAGNIQVLA
jgi:hypothetical protein